MHVVHLLEPVAALAGAAVAGLRLVRHLVGRRVAAEVLERRRGLLDLAMDRLLLLQGSELVELLWANDIGLLREHGGVVISLAFLMLPML